MKHVKEVLTNAKGELIVKYSVYEDGKLFKIARFKAWVDSYGDVDMDDKPYYTKYYTNHQNN